MGTLHCALENGTDLYVNERQKIRHYRAMSAEERRKKNAKSRFFYFLWCKGEGRNSQGCFQQRINVRVARARGRSGGYTTRILDFRPTDIVSAAFSVYRARILQIMLTARDRLALET